MLSGRQRSLLFVRVGGGFRAMEASPFFHFRFWSVGMKTALTQPILLGAS